jgi:hypothetical protein
VVPTGEIDWEGAGPRSFIERYWVCKQEMRSAVGRVSRASPVQTAVRNCTRDEGRSFEIGSQVLVSNHCKLLSSKAMVVSVAANVGTNPSG